MEILAMILARARRDAQQLLGQGYNVAHAVITVPASFGSMQRQIIGDAASVAKLNSLRVISAVAYTLMDYAMTNWSSEIRNVMCVDFGAASLDVAIANVEEGVVEIKATDCEDLGGKDIDSCLVHYLVKTLKIPLKGNVTRPLCRLRVAAEKAKRELSSQQQTRVELDALIGDQSFTCLLTRQELECYGFSFHEGCVEPMQRVLQASRLTKDCINTVIVTGGSSRIPRFLTTISQFMAQSAISRCVNADEAAARGAAMHAAILAGDKSRRLGELLLLDTTPLSIGIEAPGGRMTTLYKKNTLTGIAKTIDLAIPMLRDGSAAMRVFEGERRSAKDNILIGKLYLNFAFVLVGCAADCELSVRHQEQNNTFSFTARDKTSGKLVGLLFVPVPDRLSKDDLQTLLAKSERFDALEASEERRLSSRNALEEYVVKLLNDAVKEPDSKLNCRKKALGNECLQWLDDNQQTSEAEIRTQLARIQETMRSLTSVGERHNPAGSMGQLEESADRASAVQDDLASITVANTRGDERNVEQQDDNCSASTPRSPRVTVPTPLLTSTQIAFIDAPGAGSAQLGLAGLVAESGVEEPIPSTSAGSTYSDTEITQISTMLRNTGRSSWSLVPRLYTVLRLISQLDALDDFIEQGT
jgi:molecular chaperone DnaK (HSP70)